MSVPGIECLLEQLAFADPKTTGTGVELVQIGWGRSAWRFWRPGPPDAAARSRVLVVDVYRTPCIAPPSGVLGVLEGIGRFSRRSGDLVAEPVSAVRKDAISLLLPAGWEARSGVDAPVCARQFAANRPDHCLVSSSIRLGIKARRRLREISRKVVDSQA